MIQKILLLQQTIDTTAFAPQVAYSRWTLEDSVRLQIGFVSPTDGSCTISVASSTGPFEQLSADISKAVLEKLPGAGNDKGLLAKQLSASPAGSQSDLDNVSNHFSSSLYVFSIPVARTTTISINSRRSLDIIRVRFGVPKRMLGPTLPVMPNRLACMGLVSHAIGPSRAICFGILPQSHLQPAGSLRSSLFCCILSQSLSAICPGRHLITKAANGQASEGLILPGPEAVTGSKFWFDHVIGSYLSGGACNRERHIVQVKRLFEQQPNS